MLIDPSILPSLELSRFFGSLDALLDDGIVVASSGAFVLTSLPSFRRDTLLASFKKKIVSYYSFYNLVLLFKSFVFK